MPRVTEYPTSQEGPQPVASGGRTDEPGHGTEELGHGKAPLPAAEAVRTHAQPQAADLPHPRAVAEAPSASDGAAPSRSPVRAPATAKPPARLRAAPARRRGLPPARPDP